MLRRDPLAQPELLIQRLYAYTAYRIGDGPDAEDVTSETFARALRYRESFDPEKGEPLAWLIGIARRCIAAYYAERQEPAGELPDRPDPRDLSDSALRRLELAQAMATLDERERELVALRYGADLTAKQIAALFGLRVNTVEVALHRTLGRLRTVLEPLADSEQAASSRLGIVES